MPVGALIEGVGFAIVDELDSIADRREPDARLIIHPQKGGPGRGEAGMEGADARPRRVPRRGGGGKIKKNTRLGPGERDLNPVPRATHVAALHGAPRLPAAHPARGASDEAAWKPGAVGAASAYPRRAITFLGPTTGHRPSSDENSQGRGQMEPTGNGQRRSATRMIRDQGAGGDLPPPGRPWRRSPTRRSFSRINTCCSRDEHGTAREAARELRLRLWQGVLRVPPNRAARPQGTLRRGSTRTEAAKWRAVVGEAETDAHFS